MSNSTRFTKLQDKFGTDACFTNFAEEDIICLTADIMSELFEFEEIKLPSGCEWGIAMGDDHPHALVIKKVNDFDGDLGQALEEYIVDFIGECEDEDDEEDDDDY